MNVYNDVREVARIGWGEDPPAQFDWAKKVKKVAEIACQGGGRGVISDNLQKKKTKENYMTTDGRIALLSQKKSLSSPLYWLANILEI